ncbi:MAG: hypothetical protein EXQ82_00765 [Pseudolabrys sp.]|nr:hypothetical protein [Pseudolabrys sp.]
MTPAAALTFTDAITAAHCLTDDHHQASQAHVHQDGSSHRHSSTGGEDQGQPAKCCGLFGVNAIAPAFDVFALEPMLASGTVAAASESLFGRSSDRIDRPPRSLLSL